MRLIPRYDGEPLVTVTGSAPDPAVPLLRQRRRFGDVLRHLTDEQWAAASRCEAWAVRDVITHLAGTNQFWALSIRSALEGRPTRFLGSFDPVTTPLAMVEGKAALSTAEVLAEYDASVDDLAAAVTGLDRERWSVLGESPPGHVSLEALSLHALWDSWVHERDCLLPLGLAQEEEDDEILGSLRYAAALGPAFGRTHGDERAGRLGVVVSGPDASFVVGIGTSVTVVDDAVPDGTPTLRGPAIDVLEALSFRGPFPVELSAEDRWLVGGLDVVFDRA